MRKTRDKNKIKKIQGLLNEKEYKEHKNKTRKMMRKAQEEYYKDLFDEKKRHETDVEAFRSDDQSQTF